MKHLGETLASEKQALVPPKKALPSVLSHPTASRNSSPQPTRNFISRGCSRYGMMIQVGNPGPSPSLGISASTWEFSLSIPAQLS